MTEWPTNRDAAAEAMIADNLRRFLAGDDGVARVRELRDSYVLLVDKYRGSARERIAVRFVAQCDAALEKLGELHNAE